MSDDRLDRIEGKIDKINEAVCEVHVTLAKQQIILEEHQKRSLYNEKAVELLSKELKPLRDHVVMSQNTKDWVKVFIYSGLLIELIRLYLSRKGS